MQTARLQYLWDACFRASPAYQLVLFDRLPLEQQEALNVLQRDPDFYGVLQPRAESTLGTKSVCRDTALLFLTLQQPGRLPAYVREHLGTMDNGDIAQLVLDGILEIESGGVFYSGADACAVIGNGHVETDPEGFLARLSIKALQYGQALVLSDPLALSARMYFYNRLPVTPGWKRRFPDRNAVSKHLGLGGGGQVDELIARYWVQRVPAKGVPYPWLVWSSRRSERAAGLGHTTYKLYVSPTAEAIGEVVETTLLVLSQSRSYRFKVGGDVNGLLRPDKLIAYFDNLEDLQQAADHLGRKLAGVPVHGVPFTAEATRDGLLSWGLDPPAETHKLPGQERESWRLRMTNRLSNSLLLARSARSPIIEPWKFALQRLRLDGVDTTTWVPTATIWKEDSPPG